MHPESNHVTRHGVTGTEKATLPEHPAHLVGTLTDPEKAEERKGLCRKQVSSTEDTGEYDRTGKHQGKVKLARSRAPGGSSACTTFKAPGAACLLLRTVKRCGPTGMGRS